MACLVIVYSNLSRKKRETLYCIEENTCQEDEIPGGVSQRIHTLELL